MKVLTLLVITFLAGCATPDKSASMNPQFRYDFQGLAPIYHDQLTGDGMACYEPVTHIFHCYRIPQETEVEVCVKTDNKGIDCGPGV